MVCFDDLEHPYDVSGAIETHLVGEGEFLVHVDNRQEAHIDNTPLNVDQAVDVNALVDMSIGLRARGVQQIARLPQRQMAGEISLKLFQIEIVLEELLLSVLIRSGLGQRAAVNELTTDFGESNPFEKV